jgi:adenine/guanine phosphoribosyltransferase-like PRPP-binding protein
VPARLSPVEPIRAEIDELFASKQDLGQVLEAVARLSVRLVMQAAVEAEVSEFWAGTVTPVVTASARGIATATPN